MRRVRATNGIAARARRTSVEGSGTGADAAGRHRHAEGAIRIQRSRLLGGRWLRIPADAVDVEISHDIVVCEIRDPGDAAGDRAELAVGRHGADLNLPSGLRSSRRERSKCQNGANHSNPAQRKRSLSAESASRHRANPQHAWDHWCDIIRCRRCTRSSSSSPKRTRSGRRNHGTDKHFRQRIVG